MGPTRRGSTCCRDSPPERDLEGTETGIEGIWRYVNRLWRMASEPPALAAAAGICNAGDAVAGSHRDPPHDPQGRLPRSLTISTNSASIARLRGSAS